MRCTTRVKEAKVSEILVHEMAGEIISAGRRDARGIKEAGMGKRQALMSEMMVGSDSRNLLESCCAVKGKSQSCIAKSAQHEVSIKQVFTKLWSKQ